MKQESPEIRTYFWLEGDSLNPDEFTQLIGVLTTKSGIKGQPSSNPALRKQGRTVPQTFWEISVCENSYNTDQVIQKLLAHVWDYRDVIVAYVQSKQDVKIGVTIAISIYEDRPVYELSIDTIKKLAYLGCAFAIDDIYDYRKD